MLNDYDKIGKEHNKSHYKPGKQFSIVPTILKLATPIKGKIVIDIGCGDGFYSYHFSKEARKVYGIDNSLEQIKEARKNQRPNTEFILGDMLKIDLPKSDIINVPYIFGYLKTKSELINLFTRFYKSLNDNGKVIGLIDSPKSLIHDNKKFGSIKIVKGEELKGGANIDIELYNKGEKIITLHAFYHTKEVIEESLQKSGFSEIRWHKPITSKEGIDKYGKSFGDEYLGNCDVAYFTSVK